MSTAIEHDLSRKRQEDASAMAFADPRIAAIHTATANACSARGDADGRQAAHTAQTTAPVAGCEVQRPGG